MFDACDRTKGKQYLPAYYNIYITASLQLEKQDIKYLDLEPFSRFSRLPKVHNKTKFDTDFDLDHAHNSYALLTLDV